MTVLVTGGTGFIGSRLVKRLLRVNENVIIISRDIRTNPEMKRLVEKEEIQLIHCNLANQRELNKFKPIFGDVESVVHLAAFVPKQSDADDLSKSMENIRGTLNLVNMFNSIERFCFGSTVEVYGKPIYCPLDENHPTNPLTYYGVSKLACEKYLQKNNLPLTVLRFASVYGEGETIDRAIPNFIKSVCAGNPPVIYGDGSDLRDYVHVDDVIDGIILSLKHGKNKVYNIASGSGLSIKKVAEQIIRLGGKRFAPEFKETKKEKVDYIFEISRAKKDLHYSPKTRFEDGLKREMEWFKENSINRGLLEASIKHDEGFNKRLISYRADTIINLCKGPKILELGCGDGLVTQELVKHFSEVVAVDGSSVRIKRAKKRVLKKGKISFHVSLFEDFDPRTTFDTIVLSDTLEHVDDPILILKKAKNWLRKRGRIVVVVPNAQSLHRRIGKIMGLIPDVHELTNQDFLVGHKRYYDISILRDHITRSGLKIQKWGGILLKPLSNPQMESLGPKIADAFYEIGKEFPGGHCAEIYVQCSSSRRRKR